MKKTAESPSKQKASKNQKRKGASNPTPCLGKFGFVSKVEIGGKTCKREIELGKPLGTFKRSGCGKSFKNEHGVGKHETTCPAAQLEKKQKIANGKNSSKKINSMFEETATLGTSVFQCSNYAKDYEHKKERTMSAVILVRLTDGENNTSNSSATQSAKIDNRKHNRGSSRRIRDSNIL